MESRSLIFQRDRPSNRSTQVVYFIRQRVHNKLRQQLGQWHNKSLSTTKPQLIQCQIEIDQNYFDWNDNCQAPPTPMKNFVFVQKDKRSAATVPTTSLPGSPIPRTSVATSTNDVISNFLKSESGILTTFSKKTTYSFF